MGKGESEEEGGNSNQAVLFILPFPPPLPLFLGQISLLQKGSTQSQMHTLSARKAEFLKTLSKVLASKSMLARSKSTEAVQLCLTLLFSPFWSRIPSSANLHALT